MTRQVAFARNIARPKARDTPRSGHPAPTSLPCQPSRFHLPAPHQANPPSAQHSDREQERAETARQSTLTVTFTARKSPVQATFHARQHPSISPSTFPFLKFILSAPNGQVQPRAWSEAERASAATRCWVRCWIDHLRRNWLDFYFWSRASIRRQESNMLTNAIIGVSPDYEWQV
jgi:hypothetical protein